MLRRSPGAPPSPERLGQFPDAAAADARGARGEAPVAHGDHLVLVVALEHDRLDHGAQLLRIGDADDAGPREEGALANPLTPLLQIAARHEEGSRRRRARYLREVAVARDHDDVGAAQVLADLRDARKVLCKAYTLTDYTYLFTHEFSAREEE